MMSIYKKYIQEISERKTQGLKAKPIDDDQLLAAVISQIKDVNHPDRKDSIWFFIYNTLPGTTSAAAVKAKFLKEIILGKTMRVNPFDQPAVEKVKVLTKKFM